MSENRSRVAALVDGFHAAGIFRQFTRVNYPVWDDFVQERFTPRPTILEPIGTAPLVEVEIRDTWCAIDCLPGDAAAPLGVYSLRRASVTFNRGLERIGGLMMRVVVPPPLDPRKGPIAPMGPITATYEPDRHVEQFDVVGKDLGAFADPADAVDAFMAFVSAALGEHYGECAARQSDWLAQYRARVAERSRRSRAW